jgi:hypothetical protein
MVRNRTRTSLSFSLVSDGCLAPAVAAAGVHCTNLAVTVALDIKLADLVPAVRCRAWVVDDTFSSTRRRCIVSRNFATVIKKKIEGVAPSRATLFVEDSLGSSRGNSCRQSNIGFISRTAQSRRDAFVFTVRSWLVMRSYF